MAGQPVTRAAIRKLDEVGGEEYVLDRIAEGWGIRRICADLGVATSVFNRWSAAEPERRARFARAREHAAEAMVGDIVDIADESGDARLRVDTRKWIASKWLPDTYADKHQPTVQITITAQHLKAARFSEVIDVEADSGPELT